MKISAILVQIVKNLWYKTKPSKKLLILSLLCWLQIVVFKHGKTKIQHIAFISATYFKTSSIYPNNTVVILFNGQHPWHIKNHFVCKSSALSNSDNTVFDPSDSTYFEDYADVKLAFNPIPLCNWTTYIAVCKVAKNVASLSLTAKKKSLNTVTVPIRNAIEQKYNVIACFSPLFYNERWQLLFSTLEIYRQNGIDLQVYYIQSIREVLINLLKKYKKTGVVDIEKWVLIDLGPGNEDEMDPNAHLAWRNQAASHTDCFLKYREAAEFIIVADIDDILFPQLGKNYLEEFRYLSKQYPLAAGFTYNRTHLQVSANKTPKDFSLPHYLNSLKQTGEWGSGKSVVIPSRVQTVWLHWPIIIEKNYEMIDVPNKDNIMLHFTKWIMINSTINESQTKKITTLTNNGDPMVHKIIESINKTNLKINAEKFIAENAFKVYESLPTNILYYPLIEKCYFDIFYSRYKKQQTSTVRSYNPESCPGPIKCQLPLFPGIPCNIAKRKYSHKFISRGLEIHYPSVKDVFQRSLNGCTM